MVTPAAHFTSRKELLEAQQHRLGALLDSIAANPFQTCRVAGLKRTEPVSLEAFVAQVPFTTKAEISLDQAEHPPYGTNLSVPADECTRFHQTSGTRGEPLRWLDTPCDWSALLNCWDEVYAAAEVGYGDRVLFAFSFGPFLGFWTAFEAAARRGCLCLPGGGLTTLARLHLLLDQRATVLCCTPTYALHLAEVAHRENLETGASLIRRIIVAGEAGGSLPHVRVLLRQAWPNARIFDHHGMTEVGPVTYECPAQPGHLHIIEGAYLAEVVEPSTGQTVADGGVGELVLTTLTRTAMPLLRYRTGDLVRVKPRAGERCVCGRVEKVLEGGILGRVDDMIVVRGVNIFPSSVDAIIRSEPGISEYRVEVDRRSPMVQLQIEVEMSVETEDCAKVCSALETKLQTLLALKVPVNIVEPGSLPRFEMKARRWTEVT